MRRLLAAYALALSAAVLAAPACARVRPPVLEVRPIDVPVQAPFAQTWNAVIDHFSRNSIPIRTLERASGFVASEQVRIPYDTDLRRHYAHTLADCGAVGMMNSEFIPSSATYNVVVRGDSLTSSVRVTVAYTSRAGNKSDSPLLTCNSLGVWERDLSERVKEDAESAYRIARGGAR